MKITRTAKETALLCGRYRAGGLSLGFVPTMGALHAGHMSLVQRARAECERVVVSIFVNPTQFGPGEDLKAYPRTIEADLEACRGGGVDLVFLGQEEDMYPPGSQTWVIVESLSRPLCGLSRPIHFRGVATVVAKLFHIVRPHRAYFGQKDYQQSKVIERMVKDLHMEAEVIILETVREPDGLAMSSRNAYLDSKARAKAPRIHRALSAARNLLLEGEEKVDTVLSRLREELAPGPDLVMEYAEVLDGESLAPFPEGRVRRSPGGILVAVAAVIGGTRLIDNVFLPPEGKERPL